MHMQHKGLQQQSLHSDQQYSEGLEQEPQQELESDTSFVPTGPKQAAAAPATGAPENKAGQAAATPRSLSGPSHDSHSSPAAQQAVSAPTAAAAGQVSSPSKPTYSELQLRCQMLEAALEQQQQSSQAALTATLAGAHAVSVCAIHSWMHLALWLRGRGLSTAYLTHEPGLLSLLSQHPVIGMC